MTAIDILWCHCVVWASHAPLTWIIIILYIIGIRIWISINATITVEPKLWCNYWFWWWVSFFQVWKWRGYASWWDFRRFGMRLSHLNSALHQTETLLCCTKKCCKWSTLVWTQKWVKLAYQGCNMLSVSDTLELYVNSPCLDRKWVEWPNVLLQKWCPNQVEWNIVALKYYPTILNLALVLMVRRVFLLPNSNFKGLAASFK